jgi:glutamate formiminotransferase
VPIRPEDLERARLAALEVASRIGTDLDLPVFLYGAEGRGPAFFRRGGLDGLAERMAAGELRPDYGPARLDPAAGAVLVGARAPLVAFNVNLRTTDVSVASDIAGVVRESGGGFRGVRALGFELPRRGLVQVSMNVEDWRAARLPEIVARVAAEAEQRGVEVAGSELVGLLPAGAAADAAGAALGIEGFDDSRVLELRLLDEPKLDSLP